MTPLTQIVVKRSACKEHVLLNVSAVTLLWSRAAEGGTTEVEMVGKAPDRADDRQRRLDCEGHSVVARRLQVHSLARWRINAFPPRPSSAARHKCTLPLLGSQRAV